MAGGGDSSSTQQMPKYAREALKPFAGELQNFQQNYDPQFFGGQTYAGMDPNTEQAAQAMGGFDTGASQEYFQNSLQGDYLGLNPAMQAAVMDPAMDAAAGRFNMMGRYGSPASQASMAQAGMQAAMPYYNQERQRQQQSAQMLPAMQQLQNQQQLGAGQIFEGYAQQQIDEDMARFNFEQNKPYDIMNKWASLYGPVIGGGGGTTTQTAADGSPLAGALGGGLAGAGAASSLWGPGALAAGSFAAPFAWPMVGGAALLGSGILG